ncbi:hypothetical protein JXA70_03210 [candidate division KSB1 bacterium]|nr:hypothetical protein [candidate division KSB1 bacterium]
MAKDKSFAAKIAKAAGAASRHCPKCGEIINSLRVVECIKNKEKNSYKFKENFVPICKCNQSQIMA